MNQVITILLIILTIPLFGQNHFMGIKGGANLTNVISTDFLSNNNKRSGFNGGLTYEYLIKNNFTAGTELLYFQKGFTNDVVFTDETGNPTGEKLTASFNYVYLSYQ